MALSLSYTLSTLGVQEADMVNKNFAECVAAINTNETNIATNTSNIATNTSNIATNTSNISTNTSAISTLNGGFSTGAKLWNHRGAWFRQFSSSPTYGSGWSSLNSWGTGSGETDLWADGTYSGVGGIQNVSGATVWAILGVDVYWNTNIAYGTGVRREVQQYVSGFTVGGQTQSDWLGGSYWGVGYLSSVTLAGLNDDAVYYANVYHNDSVVHQVLATYTHIWAYCLGAA